MCVVVCGREREREEVGIKKSRGRGSYCVVAYGNESCTEWQASRWQAVHRARPSDLPAPPPPPFFFISTLSLSLIRFFFSFLFPLSFLISIFPTCYMFHRHFFFFLLCVVRSIPGSLFLGFVVYYYYQNGTGPACKSGGSIY